ncbi:hypothetical protein [uncultured Enterovirga sp.]|uniref:hypothetical protein n=1 Tax=uncultured Enterovirga sp. TaxID=2026352 RepID=UPI0035C9A106
MRLLTGALVLAGCAWSGSAAAAIPTDDAAQLTQRSQTSAATVKLVPITTQRKDANKGVNCSVTTGKKASITDPTVKPQPGAGARSIQPYAPAMPATPAPEARGPARSSQEHFRSTGDVVAGVESSRSTIGVAGTSLRMAGQQVGTAPTVMGALDANSAVRVQVNQAWNGATGSANLWVTALNALNLARTNDRSRAAIGMQAVAVAPGSSATACPVGAVGSGTAGDPCRSPGVCAAAIAGAVSDPACVTGRFVDDQGATGFFVTRVPAGNIVPFDPQTPLSLADLIAAFARSLP